MRLRNWIFVTLAALLLFAFPLCHASSNAIALDANALIQLEERATHADPREQCFLYTELVQEYTEIAGKQMAAGEMDKASLTLRRVQSLAARIHIQLARDSKKLKDAEMRMHAATHRLGQYMHLISSDDQAVVISTLKQLNKINDELLAQVFAH